MKASRVFWNVVVAICLSFYANGQNFSIAGKDILEEKFAEYMQTAPEYETQLRIYRQCQKTIDSCYLRLEKSSLTIRNATQSLSYPVRKKVLEIIEDAKNDRSGDIYEGFKTFDDATMGKIKATIRVATLYECEITILKARLRRKKVEQWADQMASLINEYYYVEFMRYELDKTLETYQQLLPLEQNIDEVTSFFGQNGYLPIEKDQPSYEKLLYLWEINMQILRKTDQRQQTFRYLKESIPSE